VKFHTQKWGQILKYLTREIARLSLNQWLTLISLLVMLNMVVMGGLFWFIVSANAPQDVIVDQHVLAQAPATRTPFPTFTVVPAQATMTLFPTPTNTMVPTWTPSITPTPPPTNTPTSTPIPTNTPVVIRAAAVAAAPAPTDTPAPTPTPNVDYTVSVRQLTPCENQGKHHIFIHVVDQAGNAMSGVELRVWWTGGEASVVTGTKAEDSSLTDFAMFKGTYYVEVKGAISEVAGPITPDIPRDELCKENNNAVANSFYHYSYEVIFTKVR
jgi:hypothetical protein